MVQRKRKQQQQQQTKSEQQQKQKKNSSNKKATAATTGQEGDPSTSDLFADPYAPTNWRKGPRGRINDSSLDLFSSANRLLLAATSDQSDASSAAAALACADQCNRFPLFATPKAPPAPNNGRMKKMKKEAANTKQPPLCHQRREAAATVPIPDNIPDFSSIEKFSLVVESVGDGGERRGASSASVSTAAGTAGNNCLSMLPPPTSTVKPHSLRPTLHFSTPVHKPDHQSQRSIIDTQDKKESRQSSSFSIIDIVSPPAPGSPTRTAAAAPAMVAFRDRDSVREVSKVAEFSRSDNFYARVKKRASSRRRVEVVEVVQQQLPGTGADCEADSSDDAMAVAVAAATAVSPVTPTTANPSHPLAETSLNSSYWRLYTAGSHRSCVLRLCDQCDPLPWTRFQIKEIADKSGDFDYPDDKRESLESSVKKLGEGVFGEVYAVTRDTGDPDACSRQLAVKVLPIAGRRRVNGEPQKRFDQVLPELLIAKKLTSLSHRYRANRCPGFSQLLGSSVYRGRLHPALCDAWRCFAEQGATENDCPAELPASQLWLTMDFAFAGEALETYRPPTSPSCSPNGCWATVPVAMAIIGQVAASLAAAEAELQFEHRDLHWGNVLIQPTPAPAIDYQVAGQSYALATGGVKATIIDFTISRLSPAPGCVMYTDLSEDEDIFGGKGDYQFDIYRLMRAECGDNWRQFTPMTNVFWLHYLATKLSGMTHSCSSSDCCDASLKRFLEGVLDCRSCQDVLQTCLLESVLLS